MSLKKSSNKISGTSSIALKKPTSIKPKDSKKTSFHINDTVKSIGDSLKASGLRLTLQREELLKLLDQSKESLTVQEIFFKLQSKKIKIDLASVYRTMEALKKINIVHTLADGKYKLCSHISCNQTFHISLECLSCHNVKEPHVSSDNEIALAKMFDLSLKNIKSIHVQYLCKNCRN